MDIARKLKEYDFTDFKFREKHPSAKSFYKVMKKFPYKGETTQDIKVKLDKELGFGTGDYGSYYYTMIRYLALALEDMKGKLN